MPPIAQSVAACLTLLTLPGCASKGAAARRGIERDGLERREILATVQTFFDAMEARDVAASQRVLVPEGVFVSLRPVDGALALRWFTNAEYLAGLGGRTDAVRETMQDPVVFVARDVAMVWTDYRFERNGALAHTGVDAFTLVRIDGRWKITGGVYDVVPADDPGR